MVSLSVSMPSSGMEELASSSQSELSQLAYSLTETTLASALVLGAAVAARSSPMSLTIFTTFVALSVTQHKMLHAGVPQQCVSHAKCFGDRFVGLLVNVVDVQS